MLLPSKRLARLVWSSVNWTSIEPDPEAKPACIVLNEASEPVVLTAQGRTVVSISSLDKSIEKDFT